MLDISTGKVVRVIFLAREYGPDSPRLSDYVGGLFRVRLADYNVERVVADDTISLFGIDGLYRRGNELIAIQNGIQPHRVAAFTLGKDGTSVTNARVLARNLPEFDEPTLGIVAGVFLGVLDHAVNVVLRKRRPTGDGYLLGLSGAEILRRHGHDAVGVDVECDLDLRNAARCRRDAGQLEAAE